jgi:hypothetical protein
MKYRNRSRYKVLLQLGKNRIKEIFPNEIFFSSERLNYSFLTEVKEEQPKVIRKPKIKLIKETKDGSNSTEA